MGQNEPSPSSSPAVKGSFQRWSLIALLGCGFVIAGLLLVIVFLLLFRGGGGTTVVGADGVRNSGLERVARASEIEAVLAVDKEAQSEALAAISPELTPAKAIFAYVNRVKAQNMEHCPPEFREALLRHLNAWNGLAIQLTREPQSLGEGVLQGLINGLGGELDGGSGRMQKARDARIDAISDTWGEVEAIAVRYGARIPSN